MTDEPTDAMIAAGLIALNGFPLEFYITPDEEADLVTAIYKAMRGAEK